MSLSRFPHKTIAPNRSPAGAGRTWPIVPEPARWRVKREGEVGRDVLGAPVQVRGGSGGPALPDKREPHNTST